MIYYVNKGADYSIELKLSSRRNTAINNHFMKAH